MVSCEAHYGKLAYVFYFQMWSSWYRQHCCNIKGSEVTHNHLKIGNGTGAKPALAGLLVERFGKITAKQFNEIETAVQRGLCQVTLKASTPAIPTAPVALAALPAPEVADGMPLAVRRKRREAPN